MPWLYYLPVGGLLLAAAWAVAVFNRLVRLRNLMQEAWSGIDVQLKRRHNLVGNLVETVKGYMAHEREVLTEVTRLRSRGEAASGAADLSETESLLSGALRRLFAVMEAYPDLKANTNAAQLQSELSSLEDAIQMARRYYNGSVRNLNIAVESFPSNLIAGAFGFHKADFFILPDADQREAPRVSLEAQSGESADDA